MFGAMRASLLVVLSVLAVPAAAQGRFAGAYRVSAWRPAPWLADSARKTVEPKADVLGKRLTFAARRVAGPAILSCDAPKYEILALPYEGLFEGNLPRPAEQARTLGFATAPVTTLRSGCDFDFHFRDARTGMFALDNVLYTIVRTR
jgi:hypothetical protein